LLSADIVQLLKRNQDADLATVRAIAAPFDRSGQLDALIKLAQRSLPR
jgi:hypothetical protein